MAFKDYRDESRRVWGHDFWGNDEITREQLQLGCMLRIADAVEKMTEPYTRLLNQVESLRREEERLDDENIRLGRVIAGYRGALNRLKRKD